jgi:hypothetical protein
MNCLKYIGIAGLLFIAWATGAQPQKINRQQLVGRHKVVVKRTDSLASLSVGNGAFAFTVDVTGLQTFPDYYKTGVPLGTQSEWGWHSFPNTGNHQFESTLKDYELNGRSVSYSVQRNEPGKEREASNYFRENLHRLQLGNIGFDILKKDGTAFAVSDLKNIQQELDLWKGEIRSRFTVDGVLVDVLTYAHPDKDNIAVKVNSPLLKEGRLRIRIRFPYPLRAFSDMGTFYQEAGHATAITQSKPQSATISHQLDTTEYFVNMAWSEAAAITAKGNHEFALVPGNSSGEFRFSALFTDLDTKETAPGFDQTSAASTQAWKGFWESGAAVDFSGSKDKRAFELERRVVLSQYLTRVQCAGKYPPQETGLTYNSWYGKPHMEMYWWHAAHFALWGRADLMEKSMGWYFTAKEGAAEIARRQGYKGVRWQKMTDNDGRESPSSVGAFLVWQQPHMIYLAELIYRNKKDKATLQKYSDLVFATADFMASFPVYDSLKGHYNLGKGLIPAQECFKAVTTFNPTYELAYWSWALEVAQDWRVRLGLKRDKDWDRILKKLAPLPVQNGVYLATESTPDCYAPDSKYTIDHPAVLAALSTIPPANGLDKRIMQNTFDTVERVWHWDHTWGWDFPLVAMTATRLGQPEQAINALFKDVTTNTYLPNGHNYQDGRLTIYLPGNGGILSAIALMCAGYDGCTTRNPGIPKNGQWTVQWENLQRMP